MFLMRFKNNKASHSLKENLQELTWNQGRYVCHSLSRHLFGNLINVFFVFSLFVFLQPAVILYVFSYHVVISTMACITPEQQSGTVFILNLLQIIAVWQRYCVHPMTHNRRKIIIRHAQTLTMSLFGPQMYQRDLWWIQTAWQTLQHPTSPHHITELVPLPSSTCADTRSTLQPVRSHSFTSAGARHMSLTNTVNLHWKLHPLWLNLNPNL